MYNFAKVAISALMLMSGVAAGAAEGAPPFKLPVPVVSENLIIPRAEIAVLDSTMSYLETGTGAPVVFVHGNPSSAYLWRNVMPFVVADHRAIAVDLIGMGWSGKPDITYTFADQYRYFEAFIDAMGLEKITLVGHDWGGAIVWEYSRLHPDRVVRLAFMEAVLPPAFPQPSFEATGEEFGGMFRAFKDETIGRKMLIEDNFFVEGVLPQMVNRTLGQEAMDTYRAPFLTEAGRKPVLVWPREVPIAGEPAHSVDLLAGIETFMGETDMPVLLAYAEPGVLVPPASVGWYQDHIRNLETAYIGQGLHFIQEDQPVAIGRALADWMRRN